MNAKERADSIVNRARQLAAETPKPLALVTPEKREQIRDRLRTCLSYSSAEAGAEGLALMALGLIADDLARLDNPADVFGDVEAFHQKYKIDYRGRPRLLTTKLQTLRTERLREEWIEYLDALEAGDVEKQFDALIDLIYIALGTIHLHGWKFREGWRRVHQANMAKRLAGPGEGKYGGDGIDIVKPEGWKAPDLSDLVK